MELRRGRHLVKLSIGLAPTWFFGYQSYTDMVGIHTVDLFMVPLVRVTLGYRGWN